MKDSTNDLTVIITQALNEMKMELGDKFDLSKINLAELERRTGISRGKLRRLKSNGFVPADDLSGGMFDFARDAVCFGCNNTA